MDGLTPGRKWLGVGCPSGYQKPPVQSRLITLSHTNHSIYCVSVFVADDDSICSPLHSPGSATIRIEPLEEVSQGQKEVKPIDGDLRPLSPTVIRVDSPLSSPDKSPGSPPPMRNIPQKGECSRANYKSLVKMMAGDSPLSIFRQR